MKAPAFLVSLAWAASLAAAPVELTVTPDRTSVHPESDNETVLQIEVTGRPSDKERTAPVNLAIVLDRSGSMTGAKIEKARQAASMAVDQLSENDSFSLVVYDDEVKVLVERQAVGDGKRIKQLIRVIEPGGGTALYDGVRIGAKQLPAKLDAEAVNRVILLSDGLANVGPSSPADLARLGKQLRADGIAVSTVGLGDDYNEMLMTALAEATHANYYYVQDAERLPAIFREELGLAQTIVARKVRITIDLAKGVKPNGLLGDENLAFEGNTLTIPVDDIPSGQTRRFLVSCRVPESESEEVSLGKVRVSYDDAGSGASEEIEESPAVRIAANRTDSARTIRPVVAQNRAILDNRLAKELAVKLADQGRNDEAAGVLLRQSMANASLPAWARSQKLGNEEATLLRTAEELQNGSLSKASRKQIDYENYQDRKQKR